MLCHTILCHATPLHTSLLYTVLQCYTRVNCATLCYTTLHHKILHYTVPYHIKSYPAWPYPILPYHHTTPYYTILYQTIQYITFFIHYATISQSIVYLVLKPELINTRHCVGFCAGDDLAVMGRVKSIQTYWKKKRLDLPHGWHKCTNQCLLGCRKNDC